ncbi:MAG: hypothetical protein J5846_06095 [Desulfovibrio sp.]|nr:hypothetical protein [Desulfovibrio sp.]
MPRCVKFSKPARPFFRPPGCTRDVPEDLGKPQELDVSRFLGYEGLLWLAWGLQSKLRVKGRQGGGISSPDFFGVLLPKENENSAFDLCQWQ